MEKELLDNLRITLDMWATNAEKIAVTLRQTGYPNEAQSFEGQATAYWAVKNYLEVNSL